MFCTTQHINPLDWSVCLLVILCGVDFLLLTTRYNNLPVWQEVNTLQTLTHHLPNMVRFLPSVCLSLCDFLFNIYIFFNIYIHIFIFLFFVLLLPHVTSTILSLSYLLPPSDFIFGYRRKQNLNSNLNLDMRTKKHHPQFNPLKTFI